MAHDLRCMTFDFRLLTYHFRLWTVCKPEAKADGAILPRVTAQVKQAPFCQGGFAKHGVEWKKIVQNHIDFSMKVCTCGLCKVLNWKHWERLITQTRLATLN